MSDMRIQAEINLGNLEKNTVGMYEHLKKYSEEDPGIIAVIKADGYGHGALPIAERLAPLSFIFGFAVATTKEALELVHAGIKKPVLILGFAFEQDFESIVKHGIRSAVFKYDTAKALSKEAVRQGKSAYIHIKLDTGMGRIGFLHTPESVEEIKRITELPGIVTEGLFSHLAKADMADKAPGAEQIDRFYAFRDELLRAGVSFKYCHILNSAGIIRFPERQSGISREGICLYGLWPSADVERDIVPIYPVMRLVSHISYIKNVPGGTPISYGGTYITDGEKRIATIPAGYADGVPRALSNRGSVLIKGCRAPVTGRVCMDQFMVDVSDIPGVKECDEAVLIGASGDESISFEDWEKLTGTLNYELACHIGKRVERVWI